MHQRLNPSHTKHEHGITLIESLIALIVVTAVVALSLGIGGYAVVLPVQDKVGRPNDVHFVPEGYEVLAKAVAASIEAQLAKK